MDPIVRNLQEQMLAQMLAARRTPPPPPVPRDQMLQQMMANRPIGTKALSALGAPPGLTDALEGAASVALDPLRGYAPEMKRFATDMTRALGPLGSPLQGTLGAAIRSAPGVAREIARPVDPGTGLPNIDAGGPIWGAPLKKAAKAADVADDYINFSKMGLSDEGEAGLRALINKYAQTPEGVPGALPNPKPVLPDAAVREAANKIDPESLFLLEPKKAGSGTFDTATSLALRDAIKGRMADLQRWTGEASTAADEASKTIATARAATVENDIARLVGIQSSARAEAGRGLRVWRQMAEETTDRGFWLGRATQKAGGHLPGDKALDLEALLKRIEDAPDDESKSLAKLGLAKWMHQFEEHGVVDVALAFRKAGLISGLKSHMRNLGGNAGFAALREVSQVPEFVADSIFSVFTKESTIAPPGVNIPRGMHAAATKGVKEAAEVLRYGNTLDSAKKMDIGYQELNSKVFGGSLADKAVNAWVNGNFRALGAEDKLFRSYAFQRAIDDGAYATARTMKLQGKLPPGSSILDHSREIATNPPKALLADAMYAADYAVFANKNALASWINSGKQGNQALRVGLDLAMPYVTTPTNIFARLFEYTPAGGAVGVADVGRQVFKHGFNAEQQKALSQAIGRGTTGSALIWAGYELAKKGMLTGQPADVAGERGVQMAAGRQPLSLRVGDTYYRINEFAPEAPLLLMGATYFNESKGADASMWDVAAATPGMALETAKELPLAQGAEILSRALESPSSALKSYGREQLGTMVPTIMADAARATDDKVRTTYLKESGIFDAVKERLPGLRGSLPALKDVYGQDVASDPWHAIDPTLHRDESRNPTKRAVADAGGSVTKPRQRTGESNEAYQLRQEVQGRLIFQGLAELVKTPEWGRMGDEERRAAVEHVRSQVGRRLSGASPAVLKKFKEQMQ